MELPKKIIDEIWNYCRLNNITDIDTFIIKMVKQGLTIEKYGATPNDKIIEKIVEIEKPIEVIKEVEVEKKVYITDDESIKKMTIELDSLEEKLENKVRETSNYKERVGSLEEQVKTLEEELRLERESHKKENKKDIYNEDKEAFFGSNISNIWNKDKKQK